MDSLRFGLMGLVVFYSTFIGSSNIELCAGYLPENDLQIPVSAERDGNLTQTDFDEVMDSIQAYYGPYIASLGGQLAIDRQWTSTTVNAYASRLSPNIYKITMHGGLARHPAITKDGLFMVACHEIGHHIGGAPKKYFATNWATNEGGADYFATLRCLRYMFHAEDNQKFVDENADVLDETLRSQCEANFSTVEERNLCIRSAMAGLSGATLFQILKQLPTPPLFNTPDPNQVASTMPEHPQPQCRLDTYFQGSLCAHDMTVPLSETNPTQGTCSAASGHTSGLRPLCWFKP